VSENLIVKKSQLIEEKAKARRHEEKYMHHWLGMLTLNSIWTGSRILFSNLHFTKKGNLDAEA